MTKPNTVLFKHATIIAYNDIIQDIEILNDASLLIEGDRITKLSNKSTITLPDSASDKSTTVIDATGKIITPGFIDTHHHLWQTAYKTLGSETTLAQYYQRYGEYGPAEQNFTPEDIYLGQLTGSLELLHSGTTTVLDHAHGDFSNETANAAIDASYDSGLRTFYAHSIHNIPNGWPIAEQIALFEKWAKDPRFKKQSTTSTSGGSSEKESLISLGLAYDNFDDGDPKLASELWSLVQRYGLSVVTTHYLGGPWKVENGPETLSRLSDPWLSSTIPVVFSHASFATQNDYQLLRKHDQYISTTPESEQHYGHTHPTSHLIQDQASLGVDTHFTYSSSMVQQARLWLQSMREANFLRPLVDQYAVAPNNPASVRQAFHLITRAGGRSLRRDDIGVIREGAKADLVVFDGDSPNMLGWSDPVAAVVLHSDVGDMKHVLVDGVFVKRDGKLTYPDYDSVRRKFLSSAKRIQKIWRETDWPALEGTWMNGFSKYVKAKEIDAHRGKGTGY